MYEDEEIMYMIMENCTGGELFQKLEEEVVLREADAAGICRQMVEAIG